MTQREPDHIGVDDPDVALMLEFQSGSEEAFVKLYRRYRDRLFNFARRILGDTARAEEATQDAFLKLYSARQKYRANSRFSTYIFRITRNHCLNILARHETTRVDRDREVENAPTGGATAETAIDAGRLRIAVREALRNLPEKQATALVLTHFDGMSYREVATVLAVSESATKSLIHRARQRLSTELRGWTDRNREMNHAV